MNTWPESLVLNGSYTLSSTPVVSSVTSMTGLIDVFKEMDGADEVASISTIWSDEEFSIFETFAAQNEGRFIGPYFDSDVEQTAELQIIEGFYSATDLGGFWQVDFKLEIINREHDTGEHLYNLFEQIPPEDLGQMAQIAKETIDNFRL